MTNLTIQIPDDLALRLEVLSSAQKKGVEPLRFGTSGLTFRFGEFAPSCVASPRAVT
jgi:hypothetical protein